MVQLQVDKNSLEQINQVVKERILLPKLEQIQEGVRQDIASQAEPFRGVSKPSLADVFATKSMMNKGKLYVHIEPVEQKAEVFWLNKIGFDTNQYVNVPQFPDLARWVSLKYQGKDKESILNGSKLLKIRAKGVTDELGSPTRDFFGNAFRKLVAERNKYGLN